MTGVGIWECQAPGCDVSIAGKVHDLRQHMEAEHPMALSMTNDEGETLRERIQAEQKNALSKRVNEEMVVSDD